MKKKLFIIAAIAGMVLVGCKKKIEEPYVLTMTTAVSGEYKLYITGTGTATIDWGDGSSDHVTLSNLPADLKDLWDYFFTHIYASAGVKTIKVTGNVLSLDTDWTGEITDLDVSKMPALKVLLCGNEKLTLLDVSENTALTVLYCNFNNLTSLNVSKNTALTKLYCYGNNLTTLTLGTHNALTELYCNDNYLGKENLVDIFNKLPTRMPADDARIYCGGGFYPNPGYSLLTPTDIQIATDKNWTVGDR